MLKSYPGAPVLVLGGGAKSIGLYAAGIAVALGSRRVDYLDSCPDRLAIAQKLGANPVKYKPSDGWFRKGEAPGPEKPLVTVDACASVSGFQYTLRSLAPGGRCTSVCFYFRKGTPTPLFQMYLNSTTLHVGVSHPRAVLPDVLKLIAGGEFHPEIVTTLRANWEDAPDAYMEKTTKVVLTRKSNFSNI
ncbi:MAG: zinc-binding dehydrogenase [Luteolibacter sp.]